MFGQHLCVDFYNCDKSVLKDGEALKRWIRTLVADIDMQAYGEPWLEHFAKDNPIAAGITIIQPIETSHIAAEAAENIGEFYLSLFSCKAFNAEVAIKMTAEFLKSDSYEKYDFKRGQKKNLFHIVPAVTRQEDGGPLVIKALTSEMGRIT